MFAHREKCAIQWPWAAALMLYLIATRWGLAPNRLYYFDSANFALALENFDPALHQPQPPGYPLFVALTRLIHLFVVRPEQVFVIAGLLAAFGAVALVWALAREMFGPPAGALGAVLLASNPVFWFGGLTNQIRLFLAVSALGVALLAWRARTKAADARWTYAMFAAIGLAGGFRPVFAGLIVPLAVYVWWRNGRRLKHLAVGSAALAAFALPWLITTAWAAGGPLRYVRLLQDYTNIQFEGTSALFGAKWESASRMFSAAVVWNLLGVIGWIWAAPFVRKAKPDREKTVFLTVAGLPAFLFSAFVHIGDPDQALASIAILCVAGGGVLADFCRDRTAGSLARVAMTAFAIQTALFFFPPTRLAKAASYRAVRAVERMNTAAFASIDVLHRAGPVTIVHYGSSVASRQLEYYYPDDYVVVLPPGSGPATVYSGRRAVPSPRGNVAYLKPGTTRVICLLPWNSTGAELSGWNKWGTVYYRNVGENENIQIGARTMIRPKP